MSVIIEERSFFLAEAEEPQDERQWRQEALTTVLEREHQFKIRSALDESDINAFTCKICTMIQTCAYGIADITDSNPNVLLEVGMMIALGKPTIILVKRGQEEKLKLPSDIIDKEVIPFQDYTEIMPKLRKMLESLPPPISPPSPIEDLEKIQPRFAEELQRIEANIVKEFKSSIEEAKLDTISVGEERKAMPPELSKRLMRLEEKLEDLRGLGFVTNSKTAFLRGNYYYNQGKYNEALADYNRSLELSPDDPNTLVNRSATYGHLERYEAALVDLNRSLELRSDDPSALTNRGLAYYHLERYEEALADLNRSLELKPDDPGTLANRGITYGKLRRHEEALADLNRSLELRSDDPNTLNNRSVTYIRLNRYEEALADLNRSLELKPDDPNTSYNLACLFSRRRKTDDALSYLEKAIKGDEKYREDAKTDEDFDNIRDDLRFKKLIESD
jgi:tetratricopeptide (TPR) repeat protein